MNSKIILCVMTLALLVLANERQLVWPSSQAVLSKIDFLRKAQQELQIWDERIQDLKDDLVEASRASEYRNRALELESRINRLQNEVRNLENADPQLVTELEEKITEEIEQLKAIYSQVTAN